MNKEKWKAFISKASTGFRKFSLSSVMVIIAAFAMIGVASMVEFSDTTVADFLISREEEEKNSSIRHLMDEAMERGEYRLATTVLKYAYTDVSDLGRQSMKYTARSVYEDYRGIGTFTIPGTRKTIEVECPGTVTAYYNPTEVSWKTDSLARIIYVTLPQKIYVENILDEEDLTRVDTDTFLNRIKDTDIEKCVEELKKDGLDQVVSEGIYDLVNESAQEKIREVFSVLQNYGISFEVKATLLNGDTETAEDDTIEEDIVETDPYESEEGSGGWLEKNGPAYDTDLPYDATPGFYFPEDWDYHEVWDPIKNWGREWLR